MVKPWFRRKWYGWGWYPATWQGWALTLLYAVTFVLEFMRVDARSHSGSDTLYAFAPQALLLIALFILACYLTGESPRWQWGRPKETSANDQNPT